MRKFAGISLVLIFFSPFLLAADYSVENSKDLIVSKLEYMRAGDPDVSMFTDDHPPLKCGTHLARALIELKDDLDPELYAGLRERPNRTDFYDYGHFRIHYDAAGTHAPPMQDSNPNNGVPDYVDSVALVFEHVWSKEIDTLGYVQPVSDGANGGGLNLFDIYLSDIGNAGYYGITYPEDLQPDNQTYTSYIVIENDYSEFIQYGYNEDPMSAVKVTAAHEFFHAVQFSIDAYEFPNNASEPNHFSQWWYEASAVWMEDVVFDEVNDYLFLNNYFYHYPSLGLEAFDISGSDFLRLIHAYASNVWGRFLEERYTRDIIHDIWDICGSVRGYNVFQATDLALNDQGSSLEDEFVLFTAWNYFTANRADTVNHYSEADNWSNPINNIPDTVNTQFYTQESPADYTSDNPIELSFDTSTPEPFGANYLVFTTYGVYNQFLGGLWTSFDGDDIGEPANRWNVAILGWSDDRDTVITLDINSSNGNGSGGFRDWARYDSLVVIPSIFGFNYLDTGTPYELSAYYDPNLVGDAPLFNNLSSYFSVEDGDCLDIALSAIDPNGDSVFFYTQPTADSLDFLTVTQTGYNTARLTFCAAAELIGTIVDLTIFASDPEGNYDAKLIQVFVQSEGNKITFKRIFPNPFYYSAGNSLNIEYILPEIVESNSVFYYIFDSHGGNVATFIDSVETRAELPPGENSVEWIVQTESGKELASGVYIIAINADGKSARSKFAVIR